MTAVFVDTVAWIALANTRDALHRKAREIFEHLWLSKASLFTSEFVLLELGNALAVPDFRTDTAEFIRNLKEAPAIKIVPSSPDLFDRGLDLFDDRPDKAWGLVDCTSFVIMADHSITEAFTEDHHFEQAGFKILL
ncbi:MAG: type II toxin-antitoxin system VapC family toxin [Blastocatellia bacterium]